MLSNMGKSGLRFSRSVVILSGKVSDALTVSGAETLVLPSKVMSMPASGISNVTVKGRTFAIVPVTETEPAAEIPSAE